MANSWLTEPVASVKARWGPAGVLMLAVIGLVVLALLAGAENKALRAIGWGLIAALVLVWAYKLYGARASGSGSKRQ